METLVAVAHHRNQYYSGGRMGNNPVRFDSMPSRGFRDINCRTFEAGMGLLTNPFQSYGPYGSPVSNRGYLSPKPQNSKASVGVISGRSKSEDVKKSKKFEKSSPIAISFKGVSASNNKERETRANMSLSELWAGPAYSKNSPPPSSLPLPKFGMKPKRTVSLELPAFESDLNLPPKAKSAPTSPTSTSARSSIDFFSDGDDATKTLRRILNLDIADD